MEEKIDQGAKIGLDVNNQFKPINLVEIKKRIEVEIEDGPIDMETIIIVVTGISIIVSFIVLYFVIYIIYGRLRKERAQHTVSPTEDASQELTSKRASNGEGENETVEP